MFLALLAAMLTLPTEYLGASQASRADAGRCTFQSLSAAERRRYQSRYKRRVRLDGKAFADAWLQEQACPTRAQQTARKKRLLDKQGRPCKRTRLEMRVTPGFGGAMSMSPIPVCAD
jgi:hypothetical protein